MARFAIAVLAVAMLGMLAAPLSGQVPTKMNYQVMLTDDSDEPLADQSVTLFFILYTEPDGPTLVWSESHETTTNSIGVASVTLGETSPLVPEHFEGPRWLEVAVNGQTLSPRREMVSSPYAQQAGDAAMLAGLAPDEYVLDDDLSEPGVINQHTNPVHWTQLYGVPSGFADGNDAEGGAGDGYSLDANDGSPTDVVYVWSDGGVTAGNSSQVFGAPAFGAVPLEEDKTAAYFRTDSDYVFGVGVFAKSDSSCGIVANSGTDADWYPGAPAAVAGMSGGHAEAGTFIAMGQGDGVSAYAWGSGDAVSADADSGYSGHFTGGLGVDISTPDGVYPSVQITSNENSFYGDCLNLDSQPGVSMETYTLHSHCYNGSAGFFDKDTYDTKYAVYIEAAAYDDPGLRVFGTIYSTSLMAREVETSRGKEAVFSVASSEVELIASGEARLTGGSARVDFDRRFAESITGREGLRITATPIGGWSALYVEAIDADGFDVKSDSGAADIEFHWVAVGRSQGHERTPEMIIANQEEEERARQLKEEEMRRRRPARRQEARPAAVSAKRP